MQICPNSATFQDNPGQNVFQLDDVLISSLFDSGNILKAQRDGINSYHLWTAPDCAGTCASNNNRTWFYFFVEGIYSCLAKFTVKGLNCQAKLFKEGMRPVWKPEGGDWQQVVGSIEFSQYNEENAIYFQLSFEHVFTCEQRIYFAFCYPWSYCESQQSLDILSAKMYRSQDIYFFRENLIYSLEYRRLDLITVTAKQGMENEEPYIDGLFPDKNPRCFQFPGKKVIFISARVHPGETPGSHIMNGIINFLCSSDIRAELLRKIFVFKLIPMINPDGVYRGHYRTDTNGRNLNRFYNSSIQSEHPTIYAIVQYLKFLSGLQFYCYYDLHAHAGKNGIFVYGNHFDNFLQQIDSCCFSKLLSLNCKNFDFENSVFSEKQMRAKDKCDGMSKEGCGRVAALKITGCSYCYTIEANYHSGKVVNEIPQVGFEDNYSKNLSPIYTNGSPHYTPELLADSGRAILISILDSLERNPYSRLQASSFQNYFNLKISVAEKLLSQIPYRLYNHLRKLQNNKETLKKYLITGKIEEKSLPKIVNNEKSKQGNLKKQQTLPTQKIQHLQFVHNSTCPPQQIQVQLNPKARNKSAPQVNTLIVKKKIMQQPQQIAKSFLKLLNNKRRKNCVGHVFIKGVNA